MKSLITYYFCLAVALLFCFNNKAVAKDRLVDEYDLIEIDDKFKVDSTNKWWGGNPLFEEMGISRRPNSYNIKKYDKSWNEELSLFLFNLPNVRYYMVPDSIYNDLSRKQDTLNTLNDSLTNTIITSSNKISGSILKYSNINVINAFESNANDTNISAIIIPLDYRRFFYFKRLPNLQFGTGISIDLNSNRMNLRDSLDIQGSGSESIFVERYNFNNLSIGIPFEISFKTLLNEGHKGLAYGIDSPNYFGIYSGVSYNFFTGIYNRSSEYLIDNDYFEDDALNTFLANNYNHLIPERSFNTYLGIEFSSATRSKNGKFVGLSGIYIEFELINIAPFEDSKFWDGGSISAGLSFYF